MLTNLGENGLERFDHVNAVDRTRILRRVLELKFKGKKTNGMTQKDRLGTGRHQEERDSEQ